MKIETEEIDESVVTLDTYNSDLNLVIDGSRYSSHPLTNEGFAFMWAGARATHGAAKGKFCFEVKVLEHIDVSHLPADEPNPHVVRVGFSVESSTLQLGEDPLSYGYGGTGKISTNCQFKDYGSSFMSGDVILAVMNMDSDPVQLGYSKNGKFLGWSYRISKNELKGNALFPHILTKNVSFEVNFGQKERPYFPLPDNCKDFVFISCLPLDQRVGATRAPKRREDCEMLMMCGIPGAGKSVWAAEHCKKNPEKKYNVLGTNNIIDKMKVMGLPRKRNYAGRWDVLIQMSTKCLNKMFEIGSKVRRNYILDQTNVYASAQNRKMRNFQGFKRIAVVVVPAEAEYKRRCAKRDREEGKDVPDSAVLEMKANFKLPEVGDIFDNVIFTELSLEEAEKLVALYNEEGRAAVGPPRKQFKSSDHSSGFGNSRGFDSERGNMSNRGGYSGRGGFDGGRGGFRGGRGGFGGNRGEFDAKRGGFDENRSGFGGNRGGFGGNRGGFEGNRSGFEGSRSGFEGSRSGSDGNRGGSDGSRGGSDGGRGSFDRNRGGRAGYNDEFENNRGGYDSSNRGGRGGYDNYNRGGRGGYDNNRGGRAGYDSARGGYDNSSRGGSGGYDSGRGGYANSNRGTSGGYDGGRGGYDSNRSSSGGYDSGRGGYNSGRGGYDSGRGGYDSGRGSYDGSCGGYNRRRPLDNDEPARFDTESLSGSGQFDYTYGKNSTGLGIGRGGSRGRGDSSATSGSRDNYGTRDFNYGNDNPAQFSSSNVGKEPALGAYDRGTSSGGRGQSSYRGGASQESFRGARGFGAGNKPASGRGGYGGSDYNRDNSSNYDSGYGDFEGSYSEKSQGGYGSSSDSYGRRDAGSYGPQGGFKKEPGTDTGGYDSTARPARGSTRPSGRASRWSAETPQASSFPEHNATVSQDQTSYSNYGTQVKTEPTSNVENSRFNSYSGSSSNYAPFVPPSQPNTGFPGMQPYGYQTNVATNAVPQPWTGTQQPSTATAEVGQAAQGQQQWSQFYQQSQPSQYFNQYYGQQAAATAAPAYGSVYSTK